MGPPSQWCAIPRKKRQNARRTEQHTSFELWLSLWILTSMSLQSGQTALRAAQRRFIDCAHMPVNVGCTDRSNMCAISSSADLARRAHPSSVLRLTLPVAQAALSPK